MLMKKLMLIAMPVLVVAVGAAPAEEFRIEPGWSHVEFSVRNLGVNTVEGRFTSFSGMVSYDASDVTRSAVSAIILVDSVDTGIKKRDTHLRAKDFFETQKYPQILFESESITRQTPGYMLLGTLTIKGHARKVKLPFTYTLETSSDGKRTLRAQATGVINRHDFGLDYGSHFSVGRDVKITLHIQAVP